MTIILIVALLSSLASLAFDFVLVDVFRSELDKFSPEQRGTVIFSARTMCWAKYGAIWGIGLSLLPLIWIVVVFGFVPNTVMGTIVLFGPALIFLLTGVGLLLFSQIVRLWARSE